MGYWCTNYGGCNNHCTNNACGSTHRVSCSTNRSISIPNITSGNKINASDIELLRTNTYNEMTQWNTNHMYNFTIRSTSSFSSGEIITAAKMNNLIQDLSGTGHGSTETVTVGSVIQATKVASNMLSIYNSLRTDCICNSDCGAHALCTCDGNCAHHYVGSDINIKENIIYI